MHYTATGDLALDIERIVVSHDHVLCMLGSLGPKMAEWEPNWHMTRIFDYVLPQLRKLGLSQTQIDQIMIENPRALFSNSLAARQS